MHRIRTKAAMPMTFQQLANMVAAVGPGRTQQEVIMMLGAVAVFIDMDWDGTVRLGGCYERHSDETLARMVWQQLLKGACAQHPAHS
jgi:hypothetical protein